MKVSRYISNEISPLPLKATMKDAKQLFDNLTFSHIPITDNGHLIGLFSERDVRGMFEENENKLIENCKNHYDTFFTKEDSNWMEVLKAFSSNETNILPVLDKENRYIGYYELTDILLFFNDTYFINEAGFLLVLEKDKNEYSMAEIAQIVESTSSKLLGVFISKIKENDVQITLKVFTEYVTELTQTFRRYSYKVLTSHKEDSYLEILQERADYFKKYINI